MAAKKYSRKSRFGSHRRTKAGRDGGDFDKRFVEGFRQASGDAYESAIEAGVPVVVASEGSIWRVVKKGGRIERVRLKEISAPVRMGAGSRIVIKP